MIFSIDGHIEMIRNGLSYIHPASVLYHPMPSRIIKTQTRRLNRGIYQVGRDYAVLSKRGVKAEPYIRIVIDRIWAEGHWITYKDAYAEGGYTPDEFEKLFRELNPKWDKMAGRFAFSFHVIEVQRNVPSIKRHVYPEQTLGGYPRL